MRMRKIIFLIYLTFTIMLFQVMTYSAAAGFWTLNGTIRDGGSCQLLSNVTVSSQYDNYASNLSNAKGQYLLLLGTGNWTVTANKSGYNESIYYTPRVENGGITHDFYLLKPGETPFNCSVTGYPAIPGSIVNITSSISTTSTTIQQIQPAKPSSVPNGLAIIAILALAVLWIGAFLHYGKKPKQPKNKE